MATKKNNITTPPNMLTEVRQYLESQQAKHPDKTITLNDIVEKIMRFGLDKAKSFAFVPVKTPVPTAPPPAPPLPDVPDAMPAPMPVTPKKPEEVVTHAWAAGLVLPCGIWKKGARRAATNERVTCRGCLDKVPAGKRR
jgi:hypothetical protein